MLVVVTCVIVFLAFTTLQMHTVLDEIVFGGQVLETSSTEVIKAVENISKYYYYYFPLSVSLLKFSFVVWRINRFTFGDCAG